MRKTTLGILFLLFHLQSLAQVNYSANDTIIPYDGYFRAGTNIGYYPGFSDEMLSELAAGNPANNVAGLGIKAIRPGLFESFLEEYGYDARLDAYALYDDLGLEDNTLIVGFPSEAHQDMTEYCPGIPSTLFANMYLDIWDNGENGTPINDDNHYASYIYQTATLYKDYIKFWEIWNEPGFDYTENRGWLPPGSPGNWWENNPDPCDYKLRAPIFHYVRLLRISYEVIKTVDPDAYVAVSGVGFPSFLDAILRNTDNPFDGSLNNDYPLQGGAYFDVMGFHSYPHFDGSLRYWDNNIMDFVHTRHSDAAADGILMQQDTFQGVLNNYGYDGTTFPLKPWIITEINLPRKEFGDYIGSAEAQRNFMIKNVVVCMQNNFLQSHIFKLAEDETYEDAFYEFDLMGLYKKLDLQDQYFQEANDEGISYKTASQLLFGLIHDPVRTAALNLPDGIRGGAFLDEQNNYTYVLWAETTIDNSEAANSNYSFPESLTIQNLIKRTWDYSLNGERTTIPSENIALTGAPIFLTEKIFTADISEGCAPQTIQFTNESPSSAISWSWTFEGGTPQTSTDQHPNVAYNNSGSFHVSLQSFDANGNLIVEQADIINMEIGPTADFSYTLNGPFLSVSNNSSNNSTNFLWDFGDGNTSTDPSPNHLFLESGTYNIQLTSSNSCGSANSSISLDITVPGSSQVNYTANDQVVEYNEPFRPGANLDFYTGWTDEQLGDIAGGNINQNVPGAGVKTIRTILPHYFLDFWGYDVRKSTFEHFNNIDLRNNVVTIGFPDSDVQDTVAHCPDASSILFENLYLDIWDGGANGTPYNDENTFASYLYQTVDTYKDQIRFWEILSGPDFDESGEKGWLPPGEAGNWWESDPDPCDYALHAPIQYYVRMLRISYEIIKTVDPDSYVTISGIGFPSFLDAVLRNSDNPVDGSVVTGYPYQGGAYFDAIGYSSLPHFDGSTIYYDTDVEGFVYERHSDAAVSGITNSKNDFETVLINYGYDGNTFPEKQWYISSCNIPRKSFDDYIGSESAQRNFIIKAYVESIKNNLRQFHVRQLAETASFDDADDPFQLMGLYQDLEASNPYNQTINTQGVAYKTVSDLLFSTEYDPVKTGELELPDSIGGAAFVDGNGNYTFVLWAKTWIDQSEFAAATYTFPAGMNLDQLYQKEWDYSQTANNTMVNSTNIPLSGTPVFLSEAENPLLPPLAQFSSLIQSGCPGDNFQFTDESLRADSWLWTFEGGVPASSTLQHPQVNYSTPGTYMVQLEVFNAAGNHVAIHSDFITIEAIPTAGFTYTVDQPWADFTNASDGATSYLWNFGDNTTSLGFNPQHFYFENGIYDVTLVAFNDCGSDTIVQQVTIASIPLADFNAIIADDCGPYTVHYQDQSSSSPTEWNWMFNGANPDFSTEENPSVVYDYPGVYEVILIVSNQYGADTMTNEVEIDPELIFDYTPILCSDETIIVNGTTYSVDQPIGTEILTGAAVNGCDSIVNISILNGDNASDVFATICEGESYEIGNEEFDTAGNYIIEETNAIGCDSIITLELTVDPVFLTELSDTINEGESYIVGNSVYTMTGAYIDTLTASNGCDSLVHLDLTVDIIDGLEEISTQVQLHYFPNPFDQTIHFDLVLSETTQLSIELVDVHGREVASIQAYERLNSGNYNYIYQADQLSQGVYFLHLKTTNEQLTRRIVKVKN